MCLSDAIRERIKELMQQKGITSNNAVATLSGISNSFNEFMSGRTELPKIDTILHICEGFGIELFEFFQSPLFKDVHYEITKK